MKATLKKIEKSWTVIIEHEDGSCNIYRFSSKSGAQKWAKLAGIEL